MYHMKIINPFHIRNLESILFPSKTSLRHIHNAYEHSILVKEVIKKDKEKKTKKRTALKI